MKSIPRPTLGNWIGEINSPRFGEFCGSIGSWEFDEIFGIGEIDIGSRNGFYEVINPSEFIRIISIREI